MVAMWLEDTLRGPRGVYIAEQLAAEETGWVGRVSVDAWLGAVRAARSAEAEALAAASALGGGTAAGTGGAKHGAALGLVRYPFSPTDGDDVDACSTSGGTSVALHGDGGTALLGFGVLRGSNLVQSGMEEEGSCSCSCVEGNACVSPYGCLDWANRFEVALRSRMRRHANPALRYSHDFNYR